MPPLIMVIDDDQPILELYEALLTDDGYRVISSQHICEDAASVEHINPDLIILDFLFGGEAQGLRMFEALKGHQATASIPIIVCTAATGTTLLPLEGYLTDPRVRLVKKPFSIELITVTVCELLALR